MPDEQIDKPKKQRRLTLKQEKFIAEYTTSGNGVQAAERAGYKGNYNILAAIASQNLNNLNINNAIILQKQDIREKTNITSAYLSSIASDLLQKCIDVGQFGNAARYIKELAMLNGCYEQPKANKEQELRNVEQRGRDRALALILEDALDKQYNGVKLIDSTVVVPQDAPGQATSHELPPEGIEHPLEQESSQTEPKPPNGAVAEVSTILSDNSSDLGV